MTYQELRERYPTFVYESFASTVGASGLQLTFTYSLLPDHTFKHTLLIARVTQEHIARLEPTEFATYCFSLGMVELFNYWKLTASPTIEIRAGTLTAKQIEWWHTLLLGGMGEYFFVNQLPFTEPNFVQIVAKPPEASQDEQKKQEEIAPSSHSNILIPLGGGKDSAVTIAVLKKYAAQSPTTIGTLLVNPTPASLDTARVAAVPTEHQELVTRILDPQLLSLNTRGYLNGHIPFSAVLAFISIFVAKLKGYSLIALSNERSSNEGNTVYRNQEINHQYSKTFAFEKDFDWYVRTFLSQKPPKYFSFLRPLYELQIARLFAPLTEYHQVFRSCNRGQKTNTWCGQCSKCLFAYTILLPFIGPQATKNIFGTDMLANRELLPIAEELLGLRAAKPFECVGTHEESMCAWHLCATTYAAHTEPLPDLLEIVSTTVLAQQRDLPQRTERLLASWNTEHLVPADLATFIKTRLQETYQI